MEHSTSLGPPAVALAVLVVLAPLVGVVGPGAPLAATGGSAVGATAATAPVGGGTATGPAQASAPPIPTNNTTARLELANFRVEQSEFETVRIGTASTLQVGADGARAQHRRLAIEQAFEDADDVEAQRGVIDRTLIDLTNRAQALEARERAAIRAYSDGNVTTATLVRRLARIDAEARQLAETLELVSRLTNRIPTDDFNAPITDIGGILAPLQGPVRHRVARALSGEATAMRVHVVASDEGVVLGTLSNGRYVREATDWSNRNVSAEPRLDFGDYGDIGDRVEELYPWVTSRKSNPEFVWVGVWSWRFRASHSQGELTAYVDASTADVYREVQRLTVEDMPATDTLVRTGNGIRVALQRTYPGGPLRVLVEDASTDAVVNADVTVDGYRLGRIGADGVVMTLEPAPPYAINVTAGGSSTAFVVDRQFNATTD
jgi:hypothetical protein